MTNKPSKLPKKLRATGVIYVDMFNFQAPVYTSYETYAKAARFYGLEPLEESGPVQGCLCILPDTDGSTFMAMVLDPSAPLSTWVHESVHMADFLMEDRDIPTDVTNTEVRAYLTGHICEQVALIMSNHLERIARKATKQQLSTQIH